MKQYDVVLYGAGGFTGKQTVAYFSRHAPPGLRWALAGRHRDKLEAARAENGAHAAEILIADSDDQATVDAVVSRTRLVLSTAGPFALYGTPVVDACVRFATHYVDITGETPWVHDLIARYHERAAAAGTRIIPCCGFDSVPSDLGAFLMARHMQSARCALCGSTWLLPAFRRPQRRHHRILDEPADLKHRLAAGWSVHARSAHGARIGAKRRGAGL